MADFGDTVWFVDDDCIKSGIVMTKIIHIGYYDYEINSDNKIYHISELVVPVSKNLEFGKKIFNSKKDLLNNISNPSKKLLKKYPEYFI